MHTIHARNVNDALPQALEALHEVGERRPCRPNSAGATVIEYPMPVATRYTAPRERVLWCPVRDANPFFHFFEALWILAGRQDVGFLARFNDRMRDFSDDGATFHGAYGHRLRHMYGEDQVHKVCDLLRNDVTDRRAVLQIWSTECDLGARSKDIPCNDLVFAKVHDRLDITGKAHPALDLTVCCRSNDAVWGAYGANAVHFSMLQEYMAAHIGVEVGAYTQVSDSLHVYEDNPYWKWYCGLDLADRDNQHHVDKYAGGQSVLHYPLFRNPTTFDKDLAAMFTDWDNNGPALPYRFYTTSAFRNVVMPLYHAHAAYKADDLAFAMATLDDAAPCDWTMAARLWLQRRIDKRAAA